MLLGDHQAAQAQLQELSDEFQKLQGDLQTQIQVRQTLSSQQQENLSVSSEFSSLKDHNTIYKMVGPVLLKQSHEEAKMSVDARLSYIEGEIKRVESIIEGLQDTMDGKRNEIMGLQVKLQGAGAGGGGGGAEG